VSETHYGAFIGWGNCIKQAVVTEKHEWMTLWRNELGDFTGYK